MISVFSFLIFSAGLAIFLRASTFFFMKKLVKLPISKFFRIPFLVEFNYVFVVLFFFFLAFSRKYPTCALSHIKYENIRLSNKEGGAVLG